jgi:FkbM family methyltransferase
VKNIKIALKHLFSPRYKYLRRYEINPGDIVIDLGANVGQETEYFLRKKAEVFAYEPNPHAFSQLQKNAGSYDKARLFPKAVSNYNGKSQLFLHRDHGKSEVEYSQASSLRGEKNNLSGDNVEVEIIDIRDVLAAHKKIRLLKIDIEGGEYDIMDAVLENANKIDYILLETHEAKYPEFREKGEILQKKIQESPYKNRICTDWF